MNSKKKSKENKLKSSKKVIISEINSLTDSDIDKNKNCIASLIKDVEEIDEYSNPNNDNDKSEDNNDLVNITEKNSPKSKEKYKGSSNEIVNNIIEIKNIKLNRLDYFDVFKCGMRMRYNCNTYFNLIKKKSNIPIKNIKFTNIIGDGNCFYKCLSKFLYCKTEYDERIRKSVSLYCKSYINEINEYQNNVEFKNGNFISTIDYINSMDKNKHIATDIDILISCFIYEMNIGIYKYSEDKSSLEYINSFIYEKNYCLDNPTMIIINEKGNYNLVYPYISPVKIINEKEMLKNYEENPYPPYLGKDKNLYLNIFNFLNSGIVNGKRKWPDYIDYIQDKKFRDKKKAEFYKKIGVKNECNLHNLDFKKKVFKYDNFDLVLSQDKYIVENNRLYLTRYEYNNNIDKKLIFKKYLIPYKKEINGILIKNHDENNHPGKDETINSIKKNNYYWISINTDVEEYIKNCTSCDNEIIEMENEKQ